MDLFFWQKPWGVNLASGDIKPDTAQVQSQSSIHALGMLGKPQAELIGHLAHHTQFAVLTPLFALAHDLQNNLVLHRMAVA